jgi:hypothetical protein
MLGNKALSEAGAITDVLGTCANRGIEARTDDGWFLMAAPVETGREGLSLATPWTALQRNAGLAGGVKLGRIPGEQRLLASAQVPVEPEVDLRTRVEQACAGFEQAGAGSEVPGAEHSKVKADALAPWDLGTICEESGWTVSERSGGDLVVDLEVPGWFQQAVLRGREDGRVVASAELTSCTPNTPPECQKALGLLLLQVCAVVRMARAAAHTCEDQTTARLEVVYESIPSVREIEHGMAALSMGCRLCAREAELVGSDERVAGAYLAMMWPVS